MYMQIVSCQIQHCRNTLVCCSTLPFGSGNTANSASRSYRLLHVPLQYTYTRAVRQHSEKLFSLKLEREGIFDDGTVLRRPPTLILLVNITSYVPYLNLSKNNIPDKRSACFWCSCSFHNPPIFIPIKEKNSEYEVYGCFCSPECACAHLINQKNLQTGFFQLQKENVNI